MRQAWRGFNLAIALLLEICALVALAYAGAKIGRGVAVSVVLAIGLPLAAAVLWGLFAAPRARFPNAVVAYSVKVLVFGGAAIGLYTAGHPALGLVFAIVALLNTVVLAFVGRNVRR